MIVGDPPHLPRYLPRKGTETSTHPPYAHPSTAFATIFTPQGDGNINKSIDFMAFLPYLPRYLPRKGTETVN